MPELAYVNVLLTLLRGRLHPAADQDRLRERGSVTLEQVAIAAGLLAIAIAAVAIIAKVVLSYTNKIH
jgi:hypothetical protein